MDQLRNTIESCLCFGKCFDQRTCRFRGSRKKFNGPLGIILGRWGWTALADDLGTVAEPIVPAVAVLLAVPVVIALVNVVAFVPGRIAARLRPAVVLRSE